MQTVESCIWAQFEQRHRTFKAGKVNDPPDEADHAPGVVLVEGSRIRARRQVVDDELGNSNTLKPVPQAGPSITEIINPELVAAR